MTRESRKVQWFCCSVSLQILEQYRQVGRNGLKPFGTRVRHNGGAPSVRLYLCFAGYRSLKRNRRGAGYNRIGRSSLGFRAPVWAGIHPHSTRHAHEAESLRLIVGADLLTD
jgi:hypothetical protein